MSESVDVYWSFRSPYSYLACPQLMALSGAYDVTVNLRVVLPIAVRARDALFDGSNPHKVPYILMDWQRRAEFLGLPHAWPRPDPIVQNIQTMQVAEEQPYIFRLSKLGVEAQRQGHGMAFARQVSHRIFGGTQDWHLGDHLDEAAQAAGLDLTQMDAAIAAGGHMEEIEANQQALDKAGHWGVPTMVVRDEPFFGQDRIDTLAWRLGQLGLKK